MQNNIKNLRQNDINIVWGKEWIEQKNADIENFFSDLLFQLGYQKYKRCIPEDVLNIIDIGAGTGRYGVKFAQDFPKSKVYVTDILEDSLDIARNVGKVVGVNNVVYQKEDTMKMTFADNYFDVVFCDVVIQHIPDYKIAVREMVRILKPGGIIIVSGMNVWNPHNLYKFCLRLFGKKYKYGYEKSFTHSELRCLFYDNNLKVLKNDGFYFAYGVLRLKRVHRIFKFFGRICNRFSKIIDPLVGGRFSKYFGFEIFIVGEKK